MTLAKKMVIGLMVCMFVAMPLSAMALDEDDACDAINQKMLTEINGNKAGAVEIVSTFVTANQECADKFVAAAIGVDGVNVPGIVKAGTQAAPQNAALIAGKAVEAKPQMAVAITAAAIEGAPAHREAIRTAAKSAAPDNLKNAVANVKGDVVPDPESEPSRNPIRDRLPGGDNDVDDENNAGDLNPASPI